MNIFEGELKYDSGIVSILYNYIVLWNKSEKGKIKEAKLKVMKL